MTALPGDVARCNATVREAFQEVFQAMVGAIARDVRNTARKPEENPLRLQLFALAAWL
jgi:hypothetical protein